MNIESGCRSPILELIRDKPFQIKKGAVAKVPFRYRMASRLSDATREYKEYKEKE